MLMFNTQGASIMPSLLNRRGGSPVHLWVLATAALLFLSCRGTTSIKTLLDDPSRFDGQTVRIAGEVRGSVGALGFGAYQVTDGTGTLPVVSQAGGAPREGARVGVEGTFRSAYTLGGRTAAVLVEQRRYTP
jgi:hypothetical protein